MRNIHLFFESYCPLIQAFLLKRNIATTGKSSSSSQGLVKETTWGTMEIDRFASSVNHDQQVPSTLNDEHPSWKTNVKEFYLEGTCC